MSDSNRPMSTEKEPVVPEQMELLVPEEGITNKRSLDLVVRYSNDMNVATNTLSLIEQRLIITAIASVPFNHKVSSKTMFNVTKTNMIDLGCDPNSVYQQMKNGAAGLLNRTITIPNWVGPDGRIYDYYTTHYVSSAAYREKDSVVALRFDEEIIPLISGLRKQLFTQYKLKEISGFRSQYAQPIYSMLMQFMRQKGGEIKEEGWMVIKLDDLRRRLDIGDKFQAFSRFKAKVVDVALKQINQSPYTRFSATVEADQETKIRKKITALRFRMKRKIPIDEQPTDMQEEYFIGPNQKASITRRQATLTESQIVMFADWLSGNNKKKLSETKYDPLKFAYYVQTIHPKLGNAIAKGDGMEASALLRELLANPEFVLQIYDAWLKKLGVVL